MDRPVNTMTDGRAIHLYPATPHGFGEPAIARQKAAFQTLMPHQLGLLCSLAGRCVRSLKPQSPAWGVTAGSRYNRGWTL